MTIQYPTTRSEAETQAEIYQSFKLAGFLPRLEVSHQKCRFDIVVFNVNKVPLCIIECKRARKPSRNKGQLSRYLKFGLPVFIGYENNAEVLIKVAKKLDSDLKSDTMTTKI